MKPINKEPLYADFNNITEDGAVRLNTRGTATDLEKFGIKLSEEQVIWITDGDVEMTGKVTFRNGIWVAISNDEGFKDVDPDSPYHIKNLSRE